VEFTVIGVDEDRVTVRVLVSADVDKLEAGKEPQLNEAPPQPGLDLQWIETAQNIGTHSAGAPAHTIEELYEICNRDVLGTRPDLPAQMFFHPDGVLMQCGFSSEECPQCARVSIQSYGPMSVSKIPVNVLTTPGLWLCRDITGAFPPYGYPPTRFGPICQPVQWRCLSDAKRTTLPSPCVRESATPKDEGITTVEELCEIDPEGCGYPRARHAVWRSGGLVDGPAPARPPTYWEIGKRTPLGVWSFPVFEDNYPAKWPRRVITHSWRPTLVKRSRTPLPADAP
jgi:hypothetical protein